MAVWLVKPLQWIGRELDDPGIDSCRENNTFLFLGTSRPALGPTKLAVRWVWVSGWLLNKGVKRLVHEPNHSPLFVAKVKNDWSYTSARLIQYHGLHRDNSRFGQ
jgi:hypothetical protein